MKYITCFIVLLTLFSPLPALAESTQDIRGLWLSQKRDVAVRVERCGDMLCGRIAWIAPEEHPYSVTGAPLCESNILQGFSVQTPEETTWKGGQIYKADDDEHYNAILTLSDADTLKLRAYIGVPALGKTKVFTRADSATYPPCMVPERSFAQTKLQDIAPAAGEPSKNLNP